MEQVPRKASCFKGGVALESMADVKAVVMDKTGTITEGNFVSAEDRICWQYRPRMTLLRSGCKLRTGTPLIPIAVSIVTAAKEKGLQLKQAFYFKRDRQAKVSLAVMDGDVVLCGNKKAAWNITMSTSLLTNNDVFGTEVLVAVEGDYAGYLAISDTIKADAKSAIAAI